MELLKDVIKLAELSLEGGMLYVSRLYPTKVAKSQALPTPSM